MTARRHALSLRRWDVFLSYCSADYELVRQLYGKLRLAKLNVWFDDTQLLPGDPVRVAIAAAIRHARAAIVCVGVHGSGPWQDAEVRKLFERAADGHIRMAVVILPGTPAQVKPTGLLTELVWADARAGWSPTVIDKLVESLAPPKHTLRNALAIAAALASVALGLAWFGGWWPGGAAAPTTSAAPTSAGPPPPAPPAPSATVALTGKHHPSLPTPQPPLTASNPLSTVAPTDVPSPRYATGGSASCAGSLCTLYTADNHSFDPAMKAICLIPKNKNALPGGTARCLRNGQTHQCNRSDGTVATALDPPVTWTPCGR